MSRCRLPFSLMTYLYFSIRHQCENAKLRRYGLRNLNSPVDVITKPRISSILLLSSINPPIPCRLPYQRIQGLAGSVYCGMPIPTGIVIGAIAGRGGFGTSAQSTLMGRSALKFWPSNPTRILVTSKFAMLEGRFSTGTYRVGILYPRVQPRP